MPDAGANAGLLQSLGRLVRGLSALFWGLPLALVLCVQTARNDWLGALTVFPPLLTTALLLYGLWQLGSFQKQERPWRSALHRARIFALVDLGLSPFLYWWNRVPDQMFFVCAVAVLALSALLFLFHLNLVLLRLGAMLPDEALRLETRHYTLLNRILLLTFLAAGAIYLVLSQTVQVYLSQVPDLQGNPELLTLALILSSPWLLGVMVCLFLLLPLSVTMALLWKTKEVILDSVFSGNR
jgi:hypothetical protein